jgi:hypothetical protein
MPHLTKGDRVSLSFIKTSGVRRDVSAATVIADKGDHMLLNEDGGRPIMRVNHSAVIDWAVMGRASH